MQSFSIGEKSRDSFQTATKNRTCNVHRIRLKQRATRLGGTRSPHWSWGQPGRYYGRAGYRVAYGGGGRTSNDRYGRADISALPPTPVGGRFTSAPTRGKSARLRVG